MNLFQKAKRLIPYAKKEGIGRFDAFYVFNFDGKTVDVRVRLNSDEMFKFASCTCKNCSVYSNAYMCSFKLAAILAEGRQKGEIHGQTDS